MWTILQVDHEICIHCWICVMQGYCTIQEGEKHIKPDLPKTKWNEAENNCPVHAIQQVETEDDVSDK